MDYNLHTKNAPIVQRSITESTLSAALKNATAHPIHMGKSDKSTSASYRSVNVCATLGKVLEKLIKDQLLKFSLANNVISRHQHCFIPNHSYSPTGQAKFNRMIFYRLILVKHSTKSLMLCYWIR